MLRLARFRALGLLFGHPHARAASRAAALALVVCLGLFSASCNTTPTLPLPPPIASAETPDEQGFALVQGEAHALSYVSILNERTDAGVITRADQEGKFKARIAAEVGDLLTIWQEVAGEIGELKQTVVPRPR